MLITKEVVIGWNPTNREYYENLGYTYEWRKKITIPVKYLMDNSHMKVEFLCDYCKKEKIYRVWQSYIRSKKESIIQKDCCRKCWNLKLEESLMEKYDTNNASYIPEVINKIKISTRMPYDEICKRFSENNYVLLLTKEDYENDLSINSSTPLRFICSDHSDKDTKISIDFLKQGVKCKYCAIEQQSGENNWNWKGGISPINKYLRNLLKEWKNDTLIHNAYKCVISGEGGKLEIHHLYSFNKIVYETFLELDMINKIDNSIGKFTDDEVKTIEDVFLEKHNKYGLGVCLKPNIHKLFHQIYGYDNTEEQFEEFKNKLMVDG